MQRPDRDTYFMLMAATAALRGTCSRRFVGAVGVDEFHRVLGTGHNGSPPGAPHCVHETDEPCIVADHAEYNLLAHGIARDRQPRTVYCTDSACMRCAKLLIGYGVKRFVYHTPFRDTSGLDHLAQHIAVDRWSPPADWQALWSSLHQATSSYGKTPP